MRQRAAASSRQGGRGEAGFSIIQLVIVVAVVAITITFAVIGIANARASYRVQNSARRFASHIERARTDAIRRHATARAS
jgi:Tfp pilus assembly protein FimT